MRSANRGLVSQNVGAPEGDIPHTETLFLKREKLLEEDVAVHRTPSLSMYAGDSDEESTILEPNLLDILDLR